MLVYKWQVYYNDKYFFQGDVVCAKTEKEPHKHQA